MKKLFVILASVIVLVLSTIAPSLAANVDRLYGQAKDKGTVTLLNWSGDLIRPVGKFLANEQFEIIGTVDNFYKVQFGERAGYVNKNEVELVKRNDKLFDFATVLPYFPVETTKETKLTYEENGVTKTFAVLEEPGFVLNRLITDGKYGKAVFAGRYVTFALDSVKPYEEKVKTTYIQPKKGAVLSKWIGDMIIKVGEVTGEEQFTVAGERDDFYEVYTGMEMLYIAKKDVTVVDKPNKALFDFPVPTVWVPVKTTKATKLLLDGKEMFNLTEAGVTFNQIGLDDKYGYAVVGGRKVAFNVADVVAYNPQESKIKYVQGEKSVGLFNWVDDMIIHVGDLAANEQFEVVGERDNFYQIRLGEREGYVNKDEVKEVKRNDSLFDFPTPRILWLVETTKATKLTYMENGVEKPFANLEWSGIVLNQVGKDGDKGRAVVAGRLVNFKLSDVKMYEEPVYTTPFMTKKDTVAYKIKGKMRIEVAKVKKGTALHGLGEIVPGYMAVQYGSQVVHISQQDVNAGIKPLPYVKEKISKDGYVAKAKTVVYKDAKMTKVAMTITEKSMFAVQKNDGKVVTIVIGGQAFYVKPMK